MPNKFWIWKEEIQIWGLEDLGSHPVPGGVIEARKKVMWREGGQTRWRTFVNWFFENQSVIDRTIDYSGGIWRTFCNVWSQMRAAWQAWWLFVVRCYQAGSDSLSGGWLRWRINEWFSSYHYHHLQAPGHTHRQPSSVILNQTEIHNTGGGRLSVHLQRQFWKYYDVMKLF